MTARQYLRQMMWISRSFLRDLRKLKFKAIFRVLWDRRYRTDLRRMRRVIGTGEYELVRREIPLYAIRHSHSINYPRWVSELYNRMYDTLWRPEPIKVIRDHEMSRQDDDVYLVVDGNHRLAAMKLAYSPGDHVTVYEMIEVEPRYDRMRGV